MLRHSRKLWNSLRVPSSGSRLVRKLSGGTTTPGLHVDFVAVGATKLARIFPSGASPSGPHAFANIRDLKFNLYEVRTDSVTGWLHDCKYSGLVCCCYVIKVLNLTELFETEFYQDHSAESVDTAIETAVNIATQKFAPHNRKADLEEPLFDPEAHTSVIIPEVGLVRQLSRMSNNRLPLPCL